MVFLIAAVIFAFLMYKFMDEEVLGIVFSAGFVFSVTLVLGQLGMESLLLRLIIAAAAWLIVGMIIEELPASSSSTSNSSASTVKKQEVKSSSDLSIDKDYSTDYVFEGRDFLRNYTGRDRILTVPDGTYLIGNNDGVFSTNIHCFEAVYIPRSVYRIKDATLPFVEKVYYEGSQSEWNAIEIESGNFHTDYIPDYYKDGPFRNFKVQRVTFVYNVSRTSWDKTAEAIKQRATK